MQDKLILLPAKQFEIVVWRLHAMSQRQGARLLFPQNSPPKDNLPNNDIQRGFHLATHHYVLGLPN